MIRWKKEKEEGKSHSLLYGIMCFLFEDLKFFDLDQKKKKRRKRVKEDRELKVTFDVFWITLLKI